MALFFICNKIEEIQAGIIMKKMRLHIYITMGVFLVMFILGSILDLQISTAIFSKNNGFGLTVAALSMNVGYGFLAFLGGIVAYHAHKLSKVTWERVLTCVLALAFLGVSTYFDGGEFFGENGWYNPNIEWVGYLIALPLMSGCMFGGYLVGKKANNPRLVFLVIAGALFIGLSLIIGTTVVKNIFHRPRFRSVAETNIPFFAWWERCGNYKDLMNTYNLSKEEFKSFPSGHTSVCALGMFFVVFLPFAFGKDVKHQVIYFYVALAYALFVAFTRILVGAHYLSDVAMGGLITVICMYGFYEVVLHNPKIYELPQVEEQPVQEQQ